MFAFKIKNSRDVSFDESFELTDEVIFNYSTSKLFTEIIRDNFKIVCYGYCFDIRKPHNSIEQTFDSVSNTESLEALLPFLNGQYVIISIENKHPVLYTDASSIVPVYFNDDSVSTEETDRKQLNCNFKIDLLTHEVQRWYEYELNKDNESDSINLFEKLLINQYTYFSDKNLILKFKKDNFFKSLLAILKPILFQNTILHEFEKGSESENYFFKHIVKENRLNHNNQALKFKESELFYCKNYLSNANVIFKKKNSSFNGIHSTSIEDSLMKISSSSNNKFVKNYLVYEPFNVRALLNTVYALSSDKKFSTNNQVVNILSPSLNYFNFSRDKTLKDINFQQSEEIKTMINNSMESNNERFLLDTKTHHYKVSRNLAGNVNQHRLITYPASQSLKRSYEYQIDVSMANYNFMLVKSFFNNPNNANKIVVKVNNEKFTIDELYDGMYFNSNEDIKVTLQYNKDYTGLSWQKAGTLLITRS